MYVLFLNVFWIIAACLYVRALWVLWWIVGRLHCFYDVCMISRDFYNIDVGFVYGVWMCCWMICMYLWIIVWWFVYDLCMICAWSVWFMYEFCMIFVRIHYDFVWFRYDCVWFLKKNFMYDFCMMFVWLLYDFAYG